MIVIKRWVPWILIISVGVALGFRFLLNSPDFNMPTSATLDRLGTLRQAVEEYVKRGKSVTEIRTLNELVAQLIADGILVQGKVSTQFLQEDFWNTPFMFEIHFDGDITSISIRSLGANRCLDQRDDIILSLDINEKHRSVRSTIRSLRDE